MLWGRSVRGVGAATGRWGFTALVVLLALAAGSPAAASPGLHGGSGITWTAEVSPAVLHPGEFGQLVVTAHIQPGWHTYATSQPPGGPSATHLVLTPAPGITPAGPVKEPAPEKIHAVGFDVPVLEQPRSTAFGIPFKVTGPTAPAALSVTVTYEACTDRFCLPPKTEILTAALTVQPGPVRPVYSHAAGLPPQPRPETSNKTPDAPILGAVPAAPARGGSQDIATQIHHSESQGILAFLLLAVLSGFLALATPCVFPMIPITVSLFTKHEDGEGGANLAQAVTYCLGIVGTFTGLGLLLAGLFGASGIARFAANPWVNIAIAIIFGLLALSLMGYFDLALPSSWVDRAYGMTGRGGILGTLLMGLTFTLTSFTCTVPYVGTLLVATSQGSWFWPALGMLAFSSAFALPFFLLALFPRLLGRLPKSGGWLVTVKAFMGFLELGAAIKFLSNADLVWQAHLLTRALFLVIWAVIAGAAGLYLLGSLKLAHSDGIRVSASQKLAAGVALLAGAYCLAAIVGAPLGPLDAYVPPVGYTFAHRDAAMHIGGPWTEDYNQALAQARVSGKPIFVDFTGYTCTNCRWMEANVLPKAGIPEELSHFVRVQLYTDGTGEENTRDRDLEQRLFQTVALPVYAVLDSRGKPVDAFPGLTHNPQEFAQFLRHAGDNAGR